MTANVQATLAKLVSFDTTSAKSNLALIHHVQELLEDHGVSSILTHDPTGQKANLFASMGPDTEGGVVLSGHTDCVPVDGQPWETDPFELTAKGERLHGRGTADMKAFIAAALACLPEIQKARLRCPMHFAFSYDEEVGCRGVHGLLNGLPPDRPKPGFVIVGEPTSLRVIGTHKGIHAFRTRIRGHAAHSSRPDLGVNAIGLAARLIERLRLIAQEEMRQADTQSGLEPPYTTVNVGQISGGTAVNIIAQDCWFLWEFRSLPQQDPEAIPRRLQAFIDQELLPEARAGGNPVTITTEQVGTVPAFLLQPGSPALDLAAELTGDQEVGAVSFATEAGIFQKHGIPAVVCGPGDIAQAHQANEYITRQQLQQGYQMLQGVVRWASV